MSAGVPRALRILLDEDEQVNRVLVRAILARASTPVLRGATLLEAPDLARARFALTEGGVMS